MNYQIIINPELGGNDTGKSYNNTYEKDYNLRFAKELNNKLNEFGISSILTRNSDISLSDKERINYINNNINSKTIIVTVGLGSNDIEIVYGLNSKDTLAKRLSLTGRTGQTGFIRSASLRIMSLMETHIDLLSMSGKASVS